MQLIDIDLPFGAAFGTRPKRQVQANPRNLRDRSNSWSDSDNDDETEMKRLSPQASRPAAAQNRKKTKAKKQSPPDPSTLGSKSASSSAPSKPAVQKAPRKAPSKPTSKKKMASESVSSKLPFDSHVSVVSTRPRKQVGRYRERSNSLSSDEDSPIKPKRKQFT